MSLILLSGIINVYALKPEVESGKGPVKQITVTIRTDDADMYYIDAAGAMGTMAKVVIWYDSSGRLIKVEDVKYGQENSYTIEYLPNGNYVEHHINTQGKEWLRKYFVNKKGELIKKEDKNSIVRYSKFDKYGNWLVSESTSKDDPRGDTSITERKIEYFE